MTESIETDYYEFKVHVILVNTQLDSQLHRLTLWKIDDVHITLLSGSPFLEGSPYAFNGGKCFYADVQEGLKLKDNACHPEYPFICEIKKKHRTAPDEVPAEI